MKMLSEIVHEVGAKYTEEDMRAAADIESDVSSRSLIARLIATITDLHGRWEDYRDDFNTAVNDRTALRMDVAKLEAGMAEQVALNTRQADRIIALEKELSSNVSDWL